MVYMAGDNDLSTAGDNDLAEMRTVGSSDRVNVVAEFDNAGNRGTRRFRIEKNGEAEYTERLNETDSGDPEVLSDFIAWSANRYPAKKYALILWNHGCGWAPLEIDRIARAAGSVDYNTREVAERSAGRLGRAFFRTTLQTVFARHNMAERAICSDDGSGHSLDTVELHRVIAAGAELLGQPFDLLGMDACLMSNFEVAYQLREHVRFLVASEENEPADGWPYDRIIARLINAPETEARELAIAIVEDYIASYAARKFDGDVTQTAIDLSRIDGPLSELNGLAELLLADMPKHRSAVWNAQRRSTRFWNNTLWDVGHFCKELGNACADPKVIAAADAVVEAHTADPGNCLVAESHRGSKVRDCHGTTVYLVPPITKISKYYAELEFAKDFHWLDMLRAYHRAYC